ncbi:MAG TPA: hypothetical protein VFV50_08110 [Bdellovibrionales bacterium]|nr:hypothetical protein [Bdellovibrionales bacterium]
MRGTVMTVIMMFSLLVAPAARADRPKKPRPKPAPAAEAATVTLNSSVLLFHEWDYQRCPGQVAEALALGNKKINFVPTAYYVTRPDYSVERYCYRTTREPCAKTTPAQLFRLAQYLHQCFKKAVEGGADLSILPHLDWGGGTGVWRNYVVFDPLEKLADGYSYRDILLEPLLKAAMSAAGPETKIEFAFQGEMGATVFAHPASYIQLLEWIRAEAGGRSVKAGISLNFNKVDGNIKLTPETKAELQDLIDKNDFVGISAYAGVNNPPKSTDFNGSVESLAHHLRVAGIKLPLKKELHFSEIGLGGGPNGNDGMTPATQAWQAACCPWAGIRAAYTPERDPWQKPQLRKLRVAFHRALLTFLKTQPARWPVTSAYLWNAGSWDPQGLYGEGHYADPEIVEMIRTYNTTGRVPRPPK